MTWPRRADSTRWCAAEQAITDAMREVERMPADIRLTDAVELLLAARNAVADTVDHVEGLRRVPTTFSTSAICAHGQFTCAACALAQQERADEQRRFERRIAYALAAVLDHGIWFQRVDDATWSIDGTHFRGDVLDALLAWWKGDVSGMADTDR